MYRFALLFCSALFLALVPEHLLAQVVRGQVLAAEDQRAIRGAFVILVDSTGRERAASLSDSSGFFRIQAPEPGAYRLRWELVGRPIDQSEPLTLRAGTETFLRLFSFTRPQLLGAVEVNAASSCPANSDSDRLASLWVEVTKALRVSQWSVSDDRLVFDVETRRRQWDASFRSLVKEERYVYEGMKGRPFATMPPDFLSEYGYFVFDEEQQQYFAPDEKSLLHESFIDEHCLSFARVPAVDDGLIGISFTPAPDRARPDISGVFWLHADSLLLRSIDYRFTGLPSFARHDAVGGRMEFDRVHSGEWYIARWSMRMPAVTLCHPPGLLGRLLGRRDRPCLMGIVEATGEVVDVR
jgi:hypothetical protein